MIFLLPNKTTKNKIIKKNITFIKSYVEYKLEDTIEVY